VPVRRDEVEATVDAIVYNVLAVQAALVPQVALELLVNVALNLVKAEIFSEGKEISLETLYLSCKGY
jgi:hypothetical protein